VAVDNSLYSQTITNTAEYATSYAGSGSALAAFTVASAPVVTIWKSVEADEPLNLGDVVTYTVSLNNAGEAAALNLVMIDGLPPEISFGGWILQNGAVEQDGVITWDGDLTGEMMFIFTAMVNNNPSLYGQSITNTVTFTSDNTGDGADSAVISVGKPVLSINKTVETAHNPALPGDSITYTIVVRNDGTADAKDTHIWDILPVGVIGDDLDTTVTIISGNAYTITIPATLATDVALGSTIINTAHYENGDLNGEDSASFTVWGGEPILSITKSVETERVPALPGGPLTYTIVVRNDGTADAMDTHIWDMLPEGVIGEDVDITTTISTGAAYTITIHAMLSGDVALGSTIINTAYYEYGNLNGESSASFTVWAGEPVLSINKTVETAHTPALPGDPITYTIVVRNDGTADAVDTHIWDMLPEGVNGEDVDVTVTIGKGTAYTLTIPATVATDVAPGLTITNTAYYQNGELTGEASASFSVKNIHKLYLPFIMKH
jgi:uncharacterized repeat protein (TIGR01451 family)